MSVLDGPGEGTWSVFAQKVVAQRDEAREKVSMFVAASCALEEKLDRYFRQHGPSCDDHPGGYSDPDCELCKIDNEVSDALRNLLSLCAKD